MPEQTFNWDSQKYIDLVEHGNNPGLLEWENAEIHYLTTKIDSPHDKTFVDVGAGYGRVLPHLAKIAKKVIAVEIDENLGKTLRKRATEFPNCVVIMGDGNQLGKLLENQDYPSPVVVSLQNTLGPWKGDRFAAVDEMRRVAEPKKGEIVVSILRREAMENWGLEMYHSIDGLLGEYDPATSDLKNGVFRTKTGYESYWFSADERGAIKKRLGGSVVGEILMDNYHLFHISY